jgi:hypothetical protein
MASVADVHDNVFMLNIPQVVFTIRMCYLLEVLHLCVDELIIGPIIIIYFYFVYVKIIFDLSDGANCLFRPQLNQLHGLDIVPSLTGSI